uniref:Signal recognition particle subunit SRP72 n=1 Tax=Astatotilapia calliptera TaxID=8154 RepID=A0AAX7U0M5_ASTCA
HSAEMASGGISVASLWTDVNLLHENRDDVTALHCKVVCHIQNGSFKEALNVMNTHSKVLGSEVVFEKAYCEYRLNRVESSLKTIESAPEQTDKLKELYGQVLYRLERYDECKSVYTDLIRNSQDEYEEERKTNLAAVVAAMSQWEKAPMEDLGLPESTYELCYNATCSLIGQGKLTEALNKLQQDMTEEDIQSELAVIHSQMAYVMQLQGRTDEALQLYNQVIKLKPSDVGLLAVTANNIITINKDQNVFDSKKKVKLTNAEGVEYKLAKKQLQAIDFNKALLAIAIDVFKQAIEHYQSEQPGSATHLALVREAANFKLKYGRKKEAISDLEQLWKLSKHLPSADTMSFNVDVDELENSHGATYVRKKAAKVVGENPPKEQGHGEIKKKKKKKKGKLPKNYDPKVTPDPERWLPMKERSYYRGKKKGKKKDQIGKGTQGATAGASAELDASKTASSPPTSPRPGSQKPSSSGATRKKAPQKKKKGGKGGW